jgi:hypothetical protein
MTFSAFFMMKAASSAEPRLYRPLSCRRRRPRRRSPPKPPSDHEMKLRFIALHMM